MDVLIPIGWILLGVGAFATWWTLLSSTTLESRKMPAKVVVSLLVLLAGFSMLGDHAHLENGTHPRAATIFTILPIVIVLKIMARAEQKRKAQQATAEAGGEPTRAQPAIPVPRLIVNGIANPPAQAEPLAILPTQTHDDAPAPAARVAPMNEWGRRKLGDHMNVGLGIDYTDAKGESSERRIIVHSVEGDIPPDGRPLPQVLHAYCTTRKGARTFQVSRIGKAYDPDTGEIISDLATFLFGPNYRLKPPSG